MLVNTKMITKTITKINTCKYRIKGKRVMKRTIIRNEMRQSLKDNAIRLVVEEGFSNLTTKKVAQASELAEVYIYRYFESKTDLLEQCFIDAEEALGEKLAELFTRVPEINMEEHARETWYELWNYMMEHKDMIIFCTRFYNSSYFTEDMLEFKKQNFVEMMKKIRASHKGWTVENKDSDEKDMLIQYIVNVTTDYAVKVLQDELEHTETMVDFIYHRIVPPVLQEMKINYLK